MYIHLSVMAGAKQHHSLLRDGQAGLLHRRLQIRWRDLGARRDMAQVDANAFDDALLQRIFVDRRALMPK